MILFALLTAVLAQDGPGVGDGRAMSLQKKIDKVLLDAKHHLSVGKCTDVPDVAYPYRRRRETEEELEAEFAALVSEMDDGFEGKSQYGQMPSNAQLTKLEGLCRKFVNAALNDDSLE